MSDDLIRWLGGRKYTFAMMLLFALVLVRAMQWIDGAQFMVGYLSLGAGYLGVNLVDKKAAA